MFALPHACVFTLDDMKTLARSWLLFLTLFGVGMGVPAGPSHASAPMEPLFTMTHLCPSPITVDSGQFSYGSEITLGITDFFQVGTHLVRDFYQVLNANAKLSLLNLETFALALTFQAQTYNMRALDASSASTQVTSYQPGAVAGFSWIPNKLVLFVAAQASFAQVSEAGGPVSGFLSGTTVMTDLSWGYLPTRKTRTGTRQGGQTLSAGLSYDFTYAQLGFGLSHHWPGFHLGVHYYPNGGAQKFLPILTGGGTFRL